MLGLELGLGVEPALDFIAEPPQAATQMSSATHRNDLRRWFGMPARFLHAIDAD
jgi:hypothetical protein